MVRIDRLRDDANKRILKCQEGKNRVKKILDILL